MSAPEVILLSLAFSILALSIFLFIVNYKNWRTYIQVIVDMIRESMIPTDYPRDTVGYWLDILPKEERLEPLREAFRQRRLYDEARSIEVAIARINWSRSKKGFDFYDSLYHKYKYENTNSTIKN